ncbi:DUF6221 family protein [Kitasatospora azatica]|uniref:DUF6221 family protein n=1 Tax=Kitasatospora azatica TaxID=58347 RepID=UPI000565BA57|nr:DUF6221 family protein [Kitasatospora azatica]
MAHALSEFLLARLADRERTARAAGDRVIHLSIDGTVRQDPEPGGERVTWWQQAYHPAQELATTTALRSILDLHRPGYRVRADRSRAEADEPFCEACFGEPHPCPTLRLLALPYRDHPDYRSEWEPDA